MAIRLILENKKIRAEISTLGAELCSLKADGREIIWNGDPAIWNWHAPIMFPLCGALKGDKYIYEGKTYEIPRHGYARFKEFAVESQSEDRLVLLHRYDEETLVQYPFAYEFRVIFTLEENALKVEYNVKNLADTDMYFSVGAHEAYDCPDGLEAYSIVFEKEETLDSHVLTNTLLERRCVNFGKNVRVFDLKTKYFEKDALVFFDIKSEKLKLRNRNTGEEVGLEFAGNTVLLLWTQPGADYICIEPWCGAADFEDTDHCLVKKHGIVRLGGKQETTRMHKITL